MTEVTGVIIAKYVAMITVVTKLTLTDGTGGIGITAMVETDVTGHLKKIDHCVEKRIEKGDAHHPVMRINDADLMIPEASDHAVIQEVIQGDAHQMIAIDDVDQTTEERSHVDHHRDQRMNVGVLTLGGDKMKTEGNVRRRRSGGKNSDNKLRLTGNTRVLCHI